MIDIRVSQPHFITLNFLMLGKWSENTIVITCLKKDTSSGAIFIYNQEKSATS